MKHIFPATLGLVAALTWMDAAGSVGLRAQPISASAASPSGTGTDTLPSNIQPTSPLGQVAHLVQSGIDESIIQSYITNSTGTFNLDSSRIIFLTNLGTPNDLITLMMQRDQAIQQQMAANQVAPPPAPVEPDAGSANASAAIPPPEAAPDGGDMVDQTPPPDVTVNYFYDSLAPYGSWVDIEGYGRCWRPSVAVYNHDWQPYGERGHWQSTDCGWYWQSDYAWHNTFHYGRWFRNDQLGWCWWPDTVWAPSWVTWRYTDDYCGWAPLPPFTVYRPGEGFLYRGSGISVGFNFGLAADAFVFVPSEHFNDLHPHRFRCAPGLVAGVYERSRVINNLNSHDQGGHHFVFNGGIPVQHFTERGAGPIRAVSINELPNPYRRHEVFGGQLPGHNPAYSVNPANRGYQPGQVNYQGQRVGNNPVSANSGRLTPNQYNQNNAYQPRSGLIQNQPEQPGLRPVNNFNNSGQNHLPAPVSRPEPTEAPQRVIAPPVYGEPHQNYTPPPAPQRAVPAPQPAPASSGGNHSNGNNNSNNQHNH
jgi:hypothetical protein